MLARTAEPEPQPCPECGGTMLRLFGAPTVLNAAMRDGNGRFGVLKEQLKLKREAADLKSQGKLRDSDRVKREITKVGRSKND